MSFHKPALEIVRVSQLTHFVEEHCKGRWLVYRGQSEDKELVPRIGRSVCEALLAREQESLTEFKRRSRPFLELVPEDLWDWLALAQHHGMATRLLDWTDNPLAALWFCVREGPWSEKPGVLWVFEVPGQDFLSEKMEGNPFSGDRTKVFRPRHMNKRIAAQGGWFTVHKFMEKEQRFVPLENNKVYRPFLRKLLVPANSFGPLRDQLDRYGMNAVSMFPDLPGLCDYLNWRIPLTATNVAKPSKSAEVTTRKP